MKKIINALCILCMVVLVACGATELEKQLDLGDKYLEELDYSSAIEAYDAAIKIDPYNGDAYLGKAKAYEGFSKTLNDQEESLEALYSAYTTLADMFADEDIVDNLTFTDDSLSVKVLQKYMDKLDAEFVEQMNSYQAVLAENGDFDKIRELQTKYPEKTEIFDEYLDMEVNSEEVFAEYVDSVDSLVGSSFTMNVSYVENGGYGEFKASLDAPSGNLAQVYANDNQTLVMVDYANNGLTFTSYKVSDNGEVEQVSSVSLKDMVEQVDDVDLCISNEITPNNKNFLIVEQVRSAYTVADGANVDYRLVEIKEDGTLDIVFEDGVWGSDVMDVFDSFADEINALTGLSLTSNDFEKAWSSTSPLSKAKSFNIIEEITFTSYAADAYKTNGYEAVGPYQDELYSLFDNGGSMAWGEGHF